MSRWNKQQRSELLSRVKELSAQRFGANGRQLSASAWQDSIGEEHQLLMEYMENLRYKPVSRCPICQELTEVTIDTDGLDGAWWWNMCPVDTPPTLGCDHFQLFLGAVDFKGHQPTEVTQTVIAGPTRPYLIDRLMAMDGVVAVISQVLIDPGYEGFLIAYYASEPLDQSALHQEWRKDRYPLFNEDGVPVASDQKLDFWNFHLGDWMDTDKLYFVNPGDSAFKLITQIPREFHQSIDIDMLQQVTMGEIQLLEPPMGGETGIYDTVD